jgi:hypothetical protein
MTETITSRLKKAHSDGVGVGMVIAAAIIVDHSPVHAEELLGAAGIQSIADMREISCDDYDIDQLRDLVKEMQRRRRWGSRKAKLVPYIREIAK